MNKQLKFFIVDDEHLSWKEVYDRYAVALNGHPPFHIMSGEEIYALVKKNQPTKIDKWIFAPFVTGVEMVRHAFRSPEIRSNIREIPWLKFVSKLLPEKIKDSLKGENESMSIKLTTPPQSNTMRLPGMDMVELYSSQSRFSNEKVKRVLGHKQRISFDEAMELTHTWLLYQRIVS